MLRGITAENSPGLIIDTSAWIKKDQRNPCRMSKKKAIPKHIRKTAEQQKQREELKSNQREPADEFSRTARKIKCMNINQLVSI